MEESNERTRLVSSSGISGGSKEDLSSADHINPLKKQWLALKKEKLRFVVLYSCLAAIGALMMGFSLGYSSIAEIDIRERIAIGSYPTELEFQYIGGILTIGALVAGFITGPISDKLGRKMTLLLACVPSALGWATIACSWYFCKDQEPTNIIIMLLVGRCVAGFSIGSFSLVVPVYIIEISPTDLKGLFGAINQLSVTIGILLSYLATTFLDYYIVALIAVGITLIYSISILFIPETPRWLISNHERLAAEDVLHHLRGNNANIIREMNTLEKGIEKDEELTFQQKLQILVRKSSIIPLVLALVLMFFQQFCGVNVIIFYAGKVLEDANMKPNTAMYGSDFGVGIIQVLATFLSVLLVDMLGRKILLVLGGFLLSVSTCALGIYYYFLEHKDPHSDFSTVSYVAVACMAIFIVGFSLGWGPIPWIMMGELAPSQIRGVVSGLATAVNWSFAAVLTFGYSSYSDLVHSYGAWWTFAGVSALSILFVVFFLPETRGRNLEDMQEYFEERYVVGMCKSCSRSSSTIVQDTEPEHSIQQ